MVTVFAIADRGCRDVGSSDIDDGNGGRGKRVGR